jgi:hypothetical protein
MMEGGYMGTPSTSGAYVSASDPPANVTAPAITLGLMAALAGAKLLIHLLLAGRYGYFRDELYFLDCSRHLN